MKIDRYNKAMKWVTRPSRKESLKKIIDEAKATDPELYASLKDDPLRYIEIMNGRFEGTPMPKDYPRTITKTYDSPIGRIKEIKKVAVKPKTNGAYKMPEMKLDSFDWDLWLREKDPNYMTLEEEDKLVSQPSIEESNATWWNNMYYDYKKSGGELNFQQFKNMLLKEGDIGDLDAKKRLDGIRKILIA